LYTGTGASQTITNGINLSGSGGMVWIKSRSAASNNFLFDTLRGTTNEINSNTTDAQVSLANSLTAFNANGFTVNSAAGIGVNAATYASWAFRDQVKFFDVVTYTGTGANRTVSHNLGSVPGCIMVKRTDTTGDWQVYHRSLANTQYLVLNATSAVATGATRWNSTTATSSVFSLGTDASVNASGGTYVAYLFAHDAGGFGVSGTDNVITCGTYLGSNHRSKEIVTLGYEPQWVMIKNITSSATTWVMVDNMRGMANTGSQAWLAANSNAAETTGTTDQVVAASTGFFFNGSQADINEAGSTFVYIAIRRGPMKTPTSGTSVFAPFASMGGGGGGTAVNPSYLTNFPVDLAMVALKSGAVSNTTTMDRLRGSSPQITTSSTNAESANTSWKFDSNIGFYIGLSSNPDRLGWMFQRAPGFFDSVCYTGTGSNRTITHNLGVAPELMIVKCRSAVNDWAVYANNDNTDYLLLNSTAATADDNTFWNDTSPTSTVFSVGTNSDVNTNTATYVAYLFATLSGVSKVGSYTGTGTTQIINCGFTSGSRFVMIKRIDSTGDWYVWDSARGIVAGNDPYMLLNSTAAEVTSTDYVDTANSGFEISSTAPAAINANGGTFIFLAIA
jgi:hypothetical protein